MAEVIPFRVNVGIIGVGAGVDEMNATGIFSRLQDRFVPGKAGRIKT